MIEDMDIDDILSGLEEDTKKIEAGDIQSIAVELEAEAMEEANSVVVKPQEALIDLDDENALSNEIVKTSLGIVDNARKVFENFSDDVFHGKDRSTSSKEAMLKALDIQNGANKNMIDLAKVLKDKGNGNGTNILIQGISEKQAGISLNNIKDSL